MSDINLITPPDKLFNTNLDILLVYPRDRINAELQEKIKQADININVYIYNLLDSEHNIDWLLSVAKTSKFVLLDIDGMPEMLTPLISLLIANPNCYWMQDVSSNILSYISHKQVYDLTFLKLGEDFEK